MADKNKNLIITGTQNREYDLEQISSQNRSNSSEELVVQIFNYKAGENPNPANPRIGQIWLSRMIVEDSNNAVASTPEQEESVVEEPTTSTTPTTESQTADPNNKSTVKVIANLGLTDLSGD